MEQAQETGRRIVSKGEYFRVQAYRASIWGATLFLFGFTLRMIVFALDTWRQSGIIACLLVIGLAYAMFYTSREAMRQTQAIPPVVPFSHANTADVPAPECLVRASQEPVQAQEAVLLRAAAGEMQTGNAGQLLRAANEQP